jgi:TRAP-type C4-dicarboxylate transport system substrate-binding protein
MLIPSLAGEQLQLAQMMTKICTSEVGYGIGSLVFSAPKFNGLPADVQQALKETGEITGKALTARIRAADKAAYERLAVGNPKANPAVPPRLQPYNLTDAEKAQWEKLFADARAKLRGGTFNADLMGQVEEAGK